jgi:cysteine desulfurase
VLDTVRELERQGFEVTYLDVQENGLLDLDRCRQRCARTPSWCRCCWSTTRSASSRTSGHRQDVPRARHHLPRRRGAGHRQGGIDLATLPVDLMSLASHKTYGPKGIGALYVRRKPRVRIEAQMHGGGHERGMRSGTLPTHQIVGMGEAFAIAQAEMGAENERIRMLQQRLLRGCRTSSRCSSTATWSGACRTT